MKKAITLLLVFALTLGGCVKAPVRSAQMESELKWLADHGYTDDGVDLPKSTVLAVLLDIFPIPGIGHFYVGDIGDAIKSMCLFWAVVPWIKAPIDAYREAKYKNDVAYLEYARQQGWFDEKKKQDEEAVKEQQRARDEERERERAEQRERDQARRDRVERERDDRDRRDDSRPSREAPAAKPRTVYCGICGEKVTEGAAFCGACGSSTKPK